MKDLKALVAVLIFSFPLYSQGQSLACAQSGEDIAVDLDDSQHAIAQPAPDEALVYFIQDTDPAVIPPFRIASVGIDGRFVGANRGNSYFAVAVQPGWHDLCTQVLSPLAGGDWDFDHLIAEPGKVYYFRTRVFFSDSAAELSALVPIDSDDAANLITSYPLATAAEQSLYRPQPLAGHSTLATPQAQLSQVSQIPGAQLALNVKLEKAVRERSKNQPVSRRGHDPAGPPKTGPPRTGPPKKCCDGAGPSKERQDKSDHSTGTSAARKK